MNNTLEAELYKKVKIKPTQPSICKDFIGRYFGMSIFVGMILGLCIGLLLISK